MPQIGPLELIAVAAIALIVFGPQKLPEIARTLGRALNEMKRMAAEVKDEFESGLDVDAEDHVTEDHVTEDHVTDLPPGPAAEPVPEPESVPQEEEG